MRVAALKSKSDAEAIAAAEQASTALEKVLKEGDPLAAKDKAHAVFLATVAKKLTVHRALIAQSTTAEKISAHRGQIAAEKAKVEEHLQALVGKLEHDLYQGAE